MTPGVRALQIVHLIEQQWQRDGTVPTIRDIGHMIGLSSSSTIHTHLDRAVRAGLLEHRPHRCPAYFPIRSRMVDADRCNFMECPRDHSWVRIHAAD